MPEGTDRTEYHYNPPKGVEDTAADAVAGNASHEAVDDITLEIIKAGGTITHEAYKALLEGLYILARTAIKAYTEA